jgi:hypothetical protein
MGPLEHRLHSLSRASANGAAGEWGCWLPARRPLQGESGHGESSLGEGDVAAGRRQEVKERGRCSARKLRKKDAMAVGGTRLFW